MHLYGKCFSVRLLELFSGWNFEKLLAIGTYLGSEVFLLKSIKVNTQLFENREEFFWTQKELEEGYRLTQLIVKYDISCHIKQLHNKLLWQQYSPCLSQYFRTIKDTLNVQKLEFPYFKVYLESQLYQFKMNNCVNGLINEFPVLMELFHMTCWWITGRESRITEDQKAALFNSFTWKHFSMAGLHYILSNFDLPSDTCKAIYVSFDNQCLCLCCQRRKCCGSCIRSLQDCVNIRVPSIYECNHRFATKFNTYCSIQVFGMLDCKCYDKDSDCEYGTHLYDDYLFDGKIHPVYGIMSPIYQLKGVSSESFLDIQNRVYKHANIYHILQAVGLFIHRVKLFFELNNDSSITFANVIKEWLSVRSLISDFPYVAEERVRMFYEEYHWIPPPSDIQNAANYFPEH